MTLRVLFLDLNSYFASVEQQERPDLRGRPVAVVPVETDSTCCIAASYEAKAFGVRTGTNVGEARRLCPTLHLVKSRTDQYVAYHHRIIEAIESCLPVQTVHSIDEVACRLDRTQRDPHASRDLALAIKATIAERIGEAVRCSIGIAPNRFLAKIATEIEKPDGLVILEERDLPHRLFGLSLRDLPGIGPRMARRLERGGITTVEQLVRLDRRAMRQLWGSIVGEQWWHELRGEELGDAPTHRRSIGHQHVLGPELRTADGSRSVIIRLIQKAAARARSLDYWSRHMTVSIRFVDRSKWSRRLTLSTTQDTLEMLDAFAAVWPGSLARTPLCVSATLHNLVPGCSATLPLFPEARQRNALGAAVDAVNQRFGRSMVYPASMHGAQHAAPPRIAFQSIPDLHDSD